MADDEERGLKSLRRRSKSFNDVKEENLYPLKRDDQPHFHVPVGTKPRSRTVKGAPPKQIKKKSPLASSVGGTPPKSSLKGPDLPKGNETPNKTTKNSQSSPLRDGSSPRKRGKRAESQAALSSRRQESMASHPQESLFQCCVVGDLEVTEWLVKEKGALPNSRISKNSNLLALPYYMVGDTPAIVAKRFHNSSVVEYLLSLAPDSLEREEGPEQSENETPIGKPSSGSKSPISRRHCQRNKGPTVDQVLSPDLQISPLDALLSPSFRRKSNTFTSNIRWQGDWSPSRNPTPQDSSKGIPSPPHCESGNHHEKSIGTHRHGGALELQKGKEIEEEKGKGEEKKDKEENGKEEKVKEGGSKKSRLSKTSSLDEIFRQGEFVFQTRSSNRQSRDNLALNVEQPLETEKHLKRKIKVRKKDQISQISSQPVLSSSVPSQPQRQISDALVSSPAPSTPPALSPKRNAGLVRNETADLSLDDDSTPSTILSPLSLFSLKRSETSRGIIKRKWGSQTEIMREGTLSEVAKFLISVEHSTGPSGLPAIILLTYPLFTTSQTLFSELCELTSPKNEKGFCQFLKAWMQLYPEDWTSELANMCQEKLVTQAVISDCSKKELLNHLNEIHHLDRSPAKRWAESVRKKKKRTGTIDKSPGTPFKALDTSLFSTFSDSDSFSFSETQNVDEEQWLLWDETMIAEQLLLVHQSLLGIVPPRQYIKWISSKKKAKECPELWALIQHFNHLVIWVASEIVVRVRCVERVALIEKFVNIANLCLHLKNFFAAKAFYSGVTHPAISRMTKSFGMLSRETKIRLEKLQESVAIDPDNGAQYRTLLQKARPPMVPYVGLHFKDMTFISDGNPTYVGDRKINTAKFEKLAKSVMMMIQGTSVRFSGENKRDIQIWLRTKLPRLEDDQIFWWSKRVEPRDLEVMVGAFISTEIRLTKELSAKAETIEVLTIEKEKLAEIFQDQLKEKDQEIEQLQRRIAELESEQHHSSHFPPFSRSSPLLSTSSNSPITPHLSLAFLKTHPPDPALRRNLSPKEKEERYIQPLDPAFTRLVTRELRMLKEQSKKDLVDLAKNTEEFRKAL